MKYAKQNLTEIRREIDKSTIILGDFLTHSFQKLIEQEDKKKSLKMEYLPLKGH